MASSNKPTLTDSFPQLKGREGSAREKIEEYILTSGLRPGDLMPTEVELGKILGVGRSSIREAMRTLAALDIVEVRHGTGTFVGHLSLTPLVHSLAFRSVIAPEETNQVLKSIVELRTAIDLGHAETVVTNLKGKPNPDLHELVDQMLQLSKEGKSFSDQDRAFHSLLLDRTSSKLSHDIVDALWEVHTILVQRLDVPTPEDIAATAAAHGDMLRAAEQGDLAAYLAAVKNHYKPLLGVLYRSSH